MIDPNIVKSIFLAAVEKPPTERASFLNEAAGGDAPLRARVEALLKAHDDPDSFLQQPAAHFGATVELPPAEPPLAERPGTLIGPYKLLQHIGGGGMGVVFMAEQSHPVQRKVALKIIQPGMDTRQVIARFEAERQALALMDHPNIARVLDAGTTDSGSPYFVMELVKGVLITQYCDEYHLTLRERLELFVPVCQAVQHAHQKGIIHRDLKASNVLIALYDGRPVPKVIDFGVAKATGAKLTERTLFTEFGQVVGTLEYMSPEQAELNQLDIDTRSDIYSLGVLLYELLTGTTPLERKRFKETAFLEVLRLIREEEPPKPSTRLSTTEGLPMIAANRGLEPVKLNRLVRGELDWIVMKALEKDRNRRYETANGLAADVQRYLTDEAVLACPPSAAYRVRKFIRRNRVGVLAGSAIVAALVVGLCVSTWMFFREKEARQQTEARAYASDMSLAAQSANSGANLGSVQNLLSRWRDRKPDRRGWEWYYLNGLCHHDRMTIHADNNWLLSVAWSPDGKRLASAGQDNMVKIWNALTGQEIARLHGHTAQVLSVAWSPDGKRLASGSWDRTIKVWDAETTSEMLTLRGHSHDVLFVAWSPDGKKLASASRDMTAKIWDTVSGREVQNLPAQTPVWCVSWNTNGTRLASCTDTSTNIWDTSTGEKLLSLAGGLAVAWSPNGKWLATGGYGFIVSIWDAATGEKTLSLKGHRAAVMTVAWSPDGTRLASGSKGDGTVKVWDAATGNEIQSFRGHMGAARCVAWRSDGAQVASAGQDGTIKVWDVNSDDPSLAILHQPDQIHSLAWHPDGRQLATGSSDALVRIWDTTRNAEPLIRRGHNTVVWHVAWNPTGTRLVSGDENGVIKLWDLTNATELWNVEGFTNPGRNQVRSLPWSPDGKRFASVGEDSHLKIWDAAAGELVASFDFHAQRALAAAWSPDGEQLAVGAVGGRWRYEIQILDAISGTQRLTLRGHKDLFRSLAWSPDGKRLASASDDATVKLWDMDTGNEIHTLLGHSSAVYSVAWSPDGTRLATASWDLTVKIWNPDSGEEVCTLVEPIRTAPVESVAWSPDGKRIASSDIGGIILIHDSTPGQAAELIARPSPATRP